MTRGNWQRRVELNEARRNEAKQKKQRGEEKKLWKAQAQAFLTMLDRNTPTIVNSIRRRHRSSSVGSVGSVDANNNNVQSKSSSSSSLGVLHVYTDTLPSDSPPVLDLWEDDNQHGGKHSSRRNRARSISIENEKSATSRTPNSGKKKKPHPRSKESQLDESGEGDDGMVTPRLCRSYFFRGKCNKSSGGGGGGGSGKKGGGGKRSNDCRHVHYPKKAYNTLYQVLGQKNNLLSTSEDSYIETNGISKDADDLSMEMIYYFALEMNEFVTLNEDDNGAHATQLSVWMTDAMAKRNCSIGSLVYVALDDKLLFDRYQQGNVMKDEDFNNRSNVDGSATGPDQGPSQYHDGKHIATGMPASVLEYCLLFLDDAAVAAMSSVCKAWNHEIGKQSANLWKNLLTRSNWPMPKEGEEGDAKACFISHYTAVRICKGIKTGIDSLGKRISLTNNDCAIRSFDAPDKENYCCSVKIFAPNRVLAAYRKDLKLFESNGVGKLCRELVSFCIDPYKNTKKRHCKIVAMTLDDHSIGSIMQVTDDNTGAEASILVVVSREELLMADDSDAKQVIDISQSVLNYLLSCEEVDHGLLQLIDFISDGGDLDEIEVLVSNCIESCGYGRFLVEVSVSVPTEDEDEDDDSNAATLLFRKLFLFSSQAIIWMCDSNPSVQDMRPRHQDMTLETSKLEDNGRLGCQILSVSSASPGVMAGSIDPSGDFLDPVLLESSNFLLDVDQQDGWTLRAEARLRAVVFVGHVIVMADNLVRTEAEEGAISTYKCVLRFYPLHAEEEPESPSSLTIKDNIEIRKLIQLDERHVMCIGLKTLTPTPSDNQNELDGLAGHWFGNQEENNGTAPENEIVQLVSIVIDVTSRLEIYRTVFAGDYNQIIGELNSDFLNEGDIAIQLAADGGTVAAAVWWKGVVVTGEDTWHAEDDTLGRKITSNETSKSKKKKKGPKKGGKKDGFARGMSLRG